MTTIQYYCTTKPQINELVLVHFTVYKESHIEGKLIEYPECEAFLNYNDATKKKKVVDWNKIVPLNKDLVARVENIDNSVIQVSLAYIIDYKIPEDEMRKQLLEPFQSNRNLVSIIKKLSLDFKMDYETVWINIVHPIDECRRDEYDPENFPSLYKYCCEEIDKFNDIYNGNSELFEKFIEYIEKSMEEKPYKILTKLEIVSNGGVDNTIATLEKALETVHFPFTLKYISAPLFHFESMSDESTEEAHKRFVEVVKSEGEKMNPKTYVKIAE
jgi:translation initiation factor 2 alpha subunit (eIF-2alpha)